jgi:uncharacterized membrane protein YfcA
VGGVAVEVITLFLIIGGAAVVNGIVGFGYALLAVNAMAVVLGPKEGVLLMSLMAPVLSGLQVLHHRTHLPPWRRLGGVFVGALLGSLVGARMLTLLSGTALALILGCFTLGYVGTAATSTRSPISARLEKRLGPFIGFIGGVANGTLGASGPVFGSYLTAVGLRGRDFAAAISTIFFGMGIVRIAQLALLGQYDSAQPMLALVLLVPSVALQRVGFWLRGRLSAVAVYRGVLTILAVAGISLVVRALGEIL